METGALTALGALEDAFTAAVIGAAFLMSLPALGRGVKALVATVRLPAPAALPLLGLSLIVMSSSAAAERRGPASPGRSPGTALPPWSETSGAPPPQSPLVRAEASTAGAHPAFHGVRVPAEDRLFARAGERAGRATARTLHPSGKNRAGALRTPAPAPPATVADPHERPLRGTTYIVQAGDTLWDIAAKALSTSHPQTVAEFWPRIYLRNQAVVGPDPSLIRPGQTLEIPAE